MTIRLAKAAIRDLREVKAYIAADDPKAALHVILKLERAIELIGERPQIGRPVPAQAAREWSVPGLPYVIPYRVSVDLVEILRIHHTSRQRPIQW
jgi:plasmid stabilization system protein ParE